MADRASVCSFKVVKMSYLDRRHLATIRRRRGLAVASNEELSVRLIGLPRRGCWGFAYRENREQSRERCDACVNFKTR